MALLLVVVGCAPDRADSGPTYPGWALEAQHGPVEAADGVHRLELNGRALNPCEDCEVEHEAQLTVSFQVAELTGVLDLALTVGGERAERRVSREGDVLLRVPVFADCEFACVEPVLLEIHGDAQATWTASSVWLTTHDSETWTPRAELRLQ